MKKLFKLKKWLTVSEAARHLSIAFGEEVSEADVLRLALDGHLKLSVNFVNYATAKRVHVIPLSEARRAPGLRSDDQEPYEVILGVVLNDREVLEIDEAFVTLEGVLDLPMIGNERPDIEHKYQNLTNGPAVTLVGLDGTFVADTDGQLFQIQESFKPGEIETPQGRKKIERGYYPAGGLPDDAVLVVRTDALREFEKMVDQTDLQEEKPLRDRAETTYLNIIGGLLGLILGKSPAGKPQSAFENQSAIISALLVHFGNKPGISARTLDEKFAAAKRSLTAT